VASRTWCSASNQAQGLPVIGGLPGGGAGPGRCQDDRLLGWVQQAGGTGGGVQVVVEHPADRGIAVGLANDVVGLLGCVGAQQVVEGVPAGEVLGDQVRAGQLAQQAAGVGLGYGGEQPAPARPGAGGPSDSSAAGPRRSSRPTRRPTAPPAPPAVLEKLLRDPSLRHNETGRWLLRLLQANVSGTQELPAVAAAVPSHCATLIAQLARHYGRMWHGFAAELHERMLNIGPHEGAQADGED